MLQLAGVASAMGLIGIFLLTYRRRRIVTAATVGIAAGLQAAQLAGVHVFTLAVVLHVVLSAQGGGPVSVRRLAPALTALPLALTALFGDLVNSPALAIQLLLLAGSAALVSGASESDMAAMFKGLLGVVSVASAVAVLQTVGVIPTELFHREVSAIGRPAGIYSEPDWLGIHAGIGLVLGLKLMPPGLHRTLVVGLNATACLLAFARAAWVAVAVALLVQALVGQLRGQRRTETRRLLRLLSTLGVVALLAIPLASSLELRRDLPSRAASIFATDGERDIAAAARFQQQTALRSLAESAPWHGHGLSSAGRVGVSGRVEYGVAENNVASHWILGWWVDGKLLAIPLVLLFVGAAARGVWLGDLAGLLLVAVLINSLISNLMFFPITWLLLGLCMRRSRAVMPAPSAVAVRNAA